MYFHPNSWSALDLALLRVTHILTGHLPTDAWLHRVVVDRHMGWGAEIRLDSAHQFTVNFTRHNQSDAVLWDVVDNTCTAFAEALAKLREFVAEYRLCEDDDPAEQAEVQYRAALAEKARNSQFRMDYPYGN